MMAFRAWVWRELSCCPEVGPAAIATTPQADMVTTSNQQGQP